MPNSAVHAVRPSADAERIKDEFTAMISHELRTPLCAAKEAVDLLAEGVAGAATPQQAPFLDVASRNIARLSGIIDNVLDFGVLQRGQLAMNPERLALNPYLESFVAEQRPIAVGAGLRLEFEGSASVPQVSVDSRRLRQVLLNLLDNAVRYTSEGEVCVRVREDVSRGRPHALISVCDTGCGIEPAYLDQIFDPFFQISVGAGRRVGGCGIGLSLCRGLVLLHGGEIWAESELGRGTSLHILLPGADEPPLGARP